MIAILIFIRIVAGNAWALLRGTRKCQATGHPDNSRRAALSCMWTVACYLAQHAPWAGLWRGERELYEGWC